MMQFANGNLSAAVAAACARASMGVSSQEEMLGVALEAALDDGDENVVQQLMLAALREDRRSLQAHGELIFTSVEKGFAQAVTLLLASGVPGNLCLPSAETPLHVACRHGVGTDQPPRSTAARLVRTRWVAVEAILRRG